jgi:DNA-binding LytR/AlgR family response regulator
LPGIEIAGSTTDADAAIQFLNRQSVDALFLDIQMPGINASNCSNGSQRNLS